MADSIGGKQVLAFGVIWWSLATVATPIAAKLGLPFLLLVRACMGVGEVIVTLSSFHFIEPIGYNARNSFFNIN